MSSTRLYPRKRRTNQQRRKRKRVLKQLQGYWTCPFYHQGELQQLHWFIHENKDMDKVDVRNQLEIHIEKLYKEIGAKSVQRGFLQLQYEKATQNWILSISTIVKSKMGHGWNEEYVITTVSDHSMSVYRKNKSTPVWKFQKSVSEPFKDPSITY